MKKPSHIAQVRAQNAYNRKQVLYLTGMSDALLSQFQFDTGLQWLTQYTCATDDILRWILSQPLIWKWWVNEWNRRDDEYLPLLYQYYMHDSAGLTMKEKYQRLHREAFIANSLPWTLLEDGYSLAVGKLNKVSR